MAQDWQKALPEAQGSVTNHRRAEIRELYRSDALIIGGRGPYQVLIEAEWDDKCGNGSNSFFCRPKVVLLNGRRESERVGMDNVPPEILAAIPAELMALQKWNGCHPFGPWAYIENTVFLAGDRDCWGLRKGEKRQLRNGRTNVPCWSLVGVPKSTQMIDSPECPEAPTGIHWEPHWIVGEGKERELDSARSTAIWPDATDEQLCSDDLATALKARLPALLVEFRQTIERLGFTW